MVLTHPHIDSEHNQFLPERDVFQPPTYGRVYVNSGQDNGIHGVLNRGLLY